MGLLDDEISQWKRSFGLLGGIPKTLKNNPANRETVDSLLGVTGMVPGVGDVQSGLLAANDLRNGDYLSAALNGSGMLPMIPAMAGIIKQSGHLPKNMRYPKEMPSNVVTPVIGSLPDSSLYDKAGMFSVDSAANGDLRRLANGDYYASLNPTWLSKTRGKYAIGDIPSELVDYIRRVATNSDKTVQAQRTAKIPKDVRASLEKEFGKVFDYDISNASRSNSYYITHKPTGTKIRVSDHELPSHYENTASIDIRPEEVGSIAERLREIATPNTSGLLDAPIDRDAGAALRAGAGYAEPAQVGLLAGGNGSIAKISRPVNRLGKYSHD